MSDCPLSSGDPTPPWARLEQKLKQIAQNGHFALAYSGGLDSRFLAHASQQLGFIPELFHIVGPHVPREESVYAKDWATTKGLSYREVDFDPLELVLVASGSRDRCYDCKKGIFSTLLQQTSLPLCDGTNASDMGQYRPGIRAVRELGIHSPLADAGLTKSMIHHYAEMTKMEDWNQRPHPCLLTRLPYGMKPDRELLRILETGEQEILKKWTDAGLTDPDFRLRLVSGHLEVHVVPDDGKTISPELEEGILQCLSRIAPQFPDPRIRRVKKLSGFFDSTQPAYA